MYKSIIRPLLFQLSAEKAHHFTFSLTKFFFNIPGVKSVNKSLFQINSPRLERELFGLKFPNPVGLAAGFDKDAKLIDELASLGFGFIEIGTITPKAQPGNPKPRLFRLKEDNGIINRMGFNNQGIDAAIERLKNRKSNVIIGGNIGKNKITPNEEAFNDYEKCFLQLYPYVDYFVVNVSSPNTPGLRELQEKEPLMQLLNHLMDLNQKQIKTKPILLKIAPDLTNQQLDDIIEIVAKTKIDGVIATNTTINRDGLGTSKSTIDKIGNGGLSGKPLGKRATEVIRYLYDKSNAAFPIIGVGGIMSAEDALEKLEAGASLLQLYSGFIYEGPALIKQINKAVLKREI
ncbi:dihydroorotate dehydrogenase (quinone) [Marivirga tractuosa]|uniref:Dihydroorotate dehydrogenase (quinone) n=1 Tax=Marivirga tractuosa (strain ATCC 23168 / DSM 4126 / NBRC 15989 / NCIMB 1408 / VKM B-1430 / H-43) TaxID=643867 RepID=E4TNN7_MARTH|nr:quinone-dependent dihydroorotate dehydrogenase [Marivirga tractuosa]ADR21474.1 dihydroorotate dehydrogenase [Marivirga tractuosa DSM 4126]BDD14072.1 dihydroorotate dehydrogenase (quinone) [Marivirga tractuosa]